MMNQYHEMRLTDVLPFKSKIDRTRTPLIIAV